MAIWGLGNGLDSTEGSPDWDDSSRPADPAELRFRRMVDHSPDPMCVHADGLVVYVNPAGVRGIGAENAEQLVGRMITDFLHPDSILPMLERVATLRDEGDSTEPSEAVMLRLDGSPVDVEAVAVLTTWNGKPANQVIFRDLTTQRAAESALRYQAELVSHVSDAIIATTADGIVTSWNPAAEAIYRRPSARAVGLPLTEAVDADIDLAAVVAQGGTTDDTHRAVDGSRVYVRMSVATLENGYVLLCSDHTARRRAETHFESIVTSLPDGVVILDHHGALKFVNPAALRILRVDLNDLEQDYRTWATAFPFFDGNGDALSADQQPVAKTLLTHAPLENQVVGLDLVDGARVWLSVSSCLLDPADPQHSAVLVTFTDITAERDAYADLTYQANHDPLTGLPNRAQIEPRVAAAMESSQQPLTAVLFIDLDNLKLVNDELGHHAGDAIIKTAAQRLRSAMGPDEFIARYSGDEFIVLVCGATEYATLQHIMARMHEHLAEPVAIAGTHRPITASIGVTIVTDNDPRSPADIIRDADAAMYKAKSQSRGFYA